MRKTYTFLIAICVGFAFCGASQAQGQSASTAASELTAECPANQAGIFIQSAQWALLVNQAPVKTKTARGFAASLSYGLVPAKIVAEYDGEHAPVRTEIPQPILGICHMLSLPGEPVLVRLHAKKGVRQLDGGRMTVYPIVGGSKMIDANSSDIIPADVAHPDSNIWFLRAQAPLEPGEYALMLGTQNLSIYPFSVRQSPAPVTK